MFNRAKKFLGAIDLKIEIKPSGDFYKVGGQVGVFVELRCNSELHIKSATLRLVQVLTRGRGDDAKTEEIVLGQKTTDEAFDLHKDRMHELFFLLVYQRSDTDIEQLGQRGGVAGAVGRLGAWADNAQSEYYLQLDVDVADVFLDPRQKMKINIR